MKDYYVMIEDSQGYVQRIYKINASSEEEAENKAIRALHQNDCIYCVDKQDALNEINDNGGYILDEDNCETDLEDYD